MVLAILRWLSECFEAFFLGLMTPTVALIARPLPAYRNPGDAMWRMLFEDDNPLPTTHVCVCRAIGAFPFGFIAAIVMLIIWYLVGYNSRDQIISESDAQG